MMPTSSLFALALLLTRTVAAAPPGTLQLGVLAGEPIGGSTVTFGVAGAAPGAEVYLAFSDGIAGVDAGLCPPPLGGDCLDFAPGPLGTRSVVSLADDRGRALFVVTLPQQPPASDFTLQAVALGAAPDTSNVLALPVPACGDDDFEPNDDPVNAAPLQPALDARVCASFDEDWFSVEVGPLTTLEIDAVYDPNEADVDVELTDVDGVLLDGSYQNDGTEQLTWFNPTQDPVTVLLHAYAFFDDDTAGPRYHLATELVPTSECYEEPSEPNDAWRFAVALEPGTPYAARACEANEDWYELPAQAGDVVQVVLGADDADGEVAVRLYDDRARNQVGQGDDSVSYVSPVDQQLYAAVVLAGDDPLGGGNGYLITALVLPPGDCPVEAYEPNDTFAQAAELAPGRHTDLGACGDDDWYLVWRDAGQPLVVDARFPHVDGNVDLRVYGPDGALLAESRRTGTDDENVTLPQVADSGFYALRLWLVADGAGPTRGGVRYALELGG